MQVIRTILWISLTAILVAFIAMNWTKVSVNLWPLDGGNYVHFEWPVGIVALVFFLLGAAPTWLALRAGQWRLKRRIHSLENTLLASTASPGPSDAAVAAVPDAAPPPVTPRSEV